MEKARKKPTIRSLINTIGKLKSEHQITVFKLHKLSEKLTDDLSLERKRNTENKNTIEMLTQKNDSLLHQLNELKCKVNQESIDGTKNDDENNSEYEVEEIISDKMIKKNKHFLKGTTIHIICGCRKKI